MSSLTSESRSGKTHWRLRFYVEQSNICLRLGSIRKSAALKIQRAIDDLISTVRLGVLPDTSTQTWLMHTEWPIVQRLHSLGLLDQVGDLYRRRKSVHDEDGKPLTVLAYREWYLDQRSSCKPGTLANFKSVLSVFAAYCDNNEKISTIHDIDEELAFRFKSHREREKLTATVSTDLKVLKTAFNFGVKAGKLRSNPFGKLKRGSTLNESRQQIIPISHYDQLIDACPNSTWRAIIALARLAGLRCPSELTHLRWIDVNWDHGTIRVTSPKTEGQGKAQRIVPLFARLEQVLSDHWELTGDRSEYVIDRPQLRKPRASLSTRFQKISERAGLPDIPNPFRNLRLSAANDVCRLPGVTPKTVCDWFGHDIKTALKHYHRATNVDLQQALTIDPFQDQTISHSGPSKSMGHTVGHILPEPGHAPESKTLENKAYLSTEKQKIPRAGFEPATY